MLDVEQNRRAKKYITGRNDSPCAMDTRTAVFPVQSEALFRLETISSSLFRSKDWPECEYLPIGDDLFPVESRGRR